MAIVKPPKLKNASDFMTKKKVKTSTPEEYYEVTSQKLGLYDLDTPYAGSPNARRAKEAEKKISLPRVTLQEIRDMSENQDIEYVSQEEVGKRNRLAHQKEQPKQSLMERLTSNVTDENRATLGVQKKPSAPRINSQVATLAGKQPEQYSQQQSAEGDRFLSDGNIEGQVASTEKQKTDIGAVGRSLRDLPRNIGAAAVNTYDNLRKSGILPGGAEKQKVMTEEEFRNSNAITKKGYGTYENYLKLVSGLNESPQMVSSEKIDRVVDGLQEKLPSKVDNDTTLWEKMVRGAAISWLPSMASASLGGGLAGMAGQFSSNPIIIEAMRTAPLFTSGTDSGLKTAEELGLTGAKKYSYAVLSGLLEAGTERLSSLGLEGKLLGKKTSGGVGGTKEFLRAIFEESGSEMLNEVGQQLLTGQYTNYEDFELDFENIIVAGGSAALMGGFGAVGELSNGLKYRTVGTVDNQVIIETEDGRRENVNPEIVMRHQLANGRTARMAQEILKADTEIQELAKNFGEQEQTTNAMPVEDTTTPQEASEVETEPSMPIEEKPLTEPLNEVEVEKVSEEVEVEELRDIARRSATNIESLNVPDIGVDPKRFQFKSGLDEKTGAGSELDGTDTFNPDYAGTIQVWRDKTGKDWVVNGHHRLELARRAGAKNINARIFHETDGIDESRARQIGAEQNIAERSGTAKDAALIFRETGYSKEDLAALGLSVKTKFIEQAYNISKLNDRIWDKVVNKQIREEQASMIGEAFPNDSDKQNAVMDYINEEGYITDKELKEVIDGVRFSETNYEEQYTLMGLETVAKSNFKEKVKLTTKIKQSIGSEKSAFSKLVKAQSAKKIEDAGNILNQEANESRLDLLQNINEIIDFGKNRQGDPINIIINKYANEVQNGAKLNFAADKAIEEITAIVQDGGYIALAMRGIEEQSNQQMMIGDEINETQQNEPGDVEGINQDSERTEIEGQGSLFDFTESENTTAEEVNTTSEREPLETKLDNMISKNLIDSPNNRRVATNLNKKIVELGGKDRAKEFERKVKAPKVKTVTEDTDLISSDDDLMVNNMAMEAEIEPMEQATREEVASMTEFDLMDEYRESKTKQSMQNSKFSDRTKKIAENVDYLYKTVTFNGESLKSREQITGRVEAELARLETMDKENTRFTASDTSDAIMILELSDNLLNETGDAYWVGVIERAELMRKKILSNFGQGLRLGALTKPLSPKGTLIALDTDVTTTMTPAQKKGAEKINKEMTDILADVPTENGKIKLDATEIDSFVDTIMERFPNMKKNWGKQWKKQLAEGNATKSEILDSIYRASGVPRLSVEAKAEILEHLEAMAKLEEGSTEYNIHNNEIKSIIRWSRGIGFWTKLSALQTYAMLGNAKTGLKNELGNWIGFSMGQFDAEYSEFFDKQYAKTTGQRTVADRGKGVEYAKGYKEGVKRSFQDFKNKADSRQNSSKYFDDNVGRVFKHQNGGYARILVDLVSGDNKVEAAKQFATHSAAKAENLTKFIVDDRRHAFARYEMSRAAIEVTDATIKETNKGLPKEQQVVFSKEEALANLEKEIAYYTFNNKTAGAKILTDAVKALNSFSTRKATTEFGAGTLLAKFTKTPMNIIAFTTDHLGWDYATARRQYKESYKELKKTLPKPEAKKEAIQLNQRELATSKAKALTGATFIGTGMMLAALGGITPNRDDEDERLLLEAQGYKSGYMNMSGLVRNLLGGGGDKIVYDYNTGDIQDGDTLISINQFAPGGAFMLLGARIMDYLTAEEADKSFGNILTATLQGAIDSSTDLVDLPFNRTASMVINEFKYADYKEGGTTEALLNVGNKLLGSTVTSFIPAPVKQTSQLLDPYAKSYSRDSGEAVKEQIMANVPTLRDDVPYAFYVNGESIQYSGEKNAIEALWSAYVAPYYKSVVKYDKPLKSITDNVAKKKISPPTLAPNKITYSGSDYQLSKEERQEYQKAYWKTYEKTRDTQKASTSAKIDYFKKNKIKFELDKNGGLKKIK